MNPQATPKKEKSAVPTKVLTALLSPVNDWPWMVPAQALFASFFAYMASMNMALRWLLYGVVCHMLTTILLVCFVPGKKVFEDIKKDAAVKGVACLIVWLLGKEPMFQLDVMGQSVSVAALIAGYFLCGEWIGVVIDMDDLGMPFPPWVKSALQMARDRISSADIGSKVVSNFTSVSKLPDGATKTVQNATTIITTVPEKEIPSA